jgi:predicted DNA-binding protein YlxM (UPF0122 family)
MDIPEGKIEEIMTAVCGDLNSKRARVLTDKFGLFGHEELRNCEIAKKYELSKQAVHSYLVKFTSRALKLFPEMVAYV